MKDYYSILKSFFSKTNNQERLFQLEKIKNDKTALIKLFNQIKPESKDYSINKNTMKLSELKAQIKEEIINTLKENLSPVIDFQEKIELFIEEYQQEYDVMEDFADLLLSMHNQINKEILDEASKEEVENQKELNKELEKTVELSKQAGLKEEENINELNLLKPILHYIKLGDDSWVKIEYRGTGGDGNYENISNVSKIKPVNSSEISKLKLEDRIKRVQKIGKGSNSQATYGGGEIGATGPLGDTEIRVSKIDNTEDWKSNDIGGAELPKKIQSKITTAISSGKVTEQEEDDMDKQASEAAEEEKSIAKEKEDALEFQEETKDKIKKIKKDLEANKSEMLKILKIDRKDRTKAEQSLFDKMADKTKELKKLEKTL